MGLPRSVHVLCPLAVSLCLAACAGVRRDLARGESFVPPTSYRAAQPSTRSVFVAPVLDRRVPPAAARAQRWPAIYTQDDFWERPVATMVGELIARQLDEAGVFAARVDDPESADWVLEPTLTEFWGSLEERVVGRAVQARSVVHLRVLGPRDAEGMRPLLREADYTGRVEPRQGLIFLPNPSALAAVALGRAIGACLGDLDLGQRRLDGSPAAAERELEESPWAPAGARTKPASSLR